MTFLGVVENFGRKLPHPTLVFAWLCLFVIALSGLCNSLGVSALHPVSELQIQAKSLLSEQGLLYVLNNTVSNFMTFAPLGPVLVAMIGIGLADHSGYLSDAVERIARRAPAFLLSYIIVFTGVLSNLAADAGYVVLIPLAAVLYKSFGRNPLTGIAAAFAGVSGGYSANLFIGPVDIILTGITLEAAQIVEPTATLNASSNYWFLFASTFTVTLIGGLVTDHIVEPFLSGRQHQATSSPAVSKPTKSAALSVEDNKSKTHNAFIRATFAGLTYIIGISAIFLFFDLKFEEVLGGLVVLISLGFAVVGLIYGCQKNANAQAQTSSDSWIVDSMEATFVSLAGYLVLMFFASQFVAYFSWSQLGLITAIQGANVLSQWQLSATAVLLLVVFFSASINLLIGSASAKWALIAPVIIPMLMLLDIDPAYTQLAYRIGDSSTNIITPLMPYFALVLAYAQQHQKSIHLGTIMAMMIPYSVSFLTTWMLMLLAWSALRIPIGF